MALLVWILIKLENQKNQFNSFFGFQNAIVFITI
ncbi:hypothetical protein FLBR109950_03785 [Flavobacterium branchiophilum]